jgi:hypothetical protein
LDYELRDSALTGPSHSDYALVRGHLFILRATYTSHHHIGYHYVLGRFDFFSPATTEMRITRAPNNRLINFCRAGSTCCGLCPPQSWTSSSSAKVKTTGQSHMLCDFIPIVWKAPISTPTALTSLGFYMKRRELLQPLL